MTASIDVRPSVHPEHAETMGTRELRRHFVIEKLFEPGAISCTYLHEDRMMVMGVCPAAAPLAFDPAHAALVRADHLLERREMGLFNVGGAGTVSIDGKDYELARFDALYVGRGARDVRFASRDATDPAKFYLNLAPAHVSHPTQVFPAAAAKGDALGGQETANRRLLTKYIHPGAGPSCQLVMGLTRLEAGNVWNTMPPHTHDRRMEVYLYLDLAADAAVVHLMGRPAETRHLVMRNEEAVVSPPWSIHAGAGTTAYAFIWSMAGENQAFADMDAVPVATLL